MPKGENTRTFSWTFHDERDGEPATVPQSSPTASRSRASIDTAIHVTAQRHQNNQVLSAVHLNPTDWHVLFQAMIEAESAYNPSARSPAGAYGLGQLMPNTAHALGVDRKDMTQNLDGAARYLLMQLARFQSVDLALAAYNAGPHRVIAYQGVPPFAETRAYITRVNRIRSRLLNSLTSNAPVQVAQDAAPSWSALVLKLN